MRYQWPGGVTEYVNEHLSRFSIGDSVADSPVTWALHLDTFLVAFVVGAGVFYLMSRIAKNARIRNPGKGQIFCEMICDFFDRQVRDLMPDAPKIVGPLALTIFVWVVAMNSMDLVPVDLITAGGYLLTDNVFHFKLLSTADLSLTLALAISVFFMTIYYSFKVKGVGGFMHEIASAPFGIKLMPANVLLRIVEEIAKPMSLAMRLFGNMFAAEMIFLLIAAISFNGLFAFVAQPLLAVPWAIYHILVVPLQAYIFATLTIVYISMAHTKH